MNRIYPQNFDTDSLGSAKFHLTDKKAGDSISDGQKQLEDIKLYKDVLAFYNFESFLSIAGTTHDQADCCRKCFSWTLCTRRCICVSAISLIILGIIIAIIASVVTLSIPPPTPVNRLCVTTSKQTGFLCDNRETCISASEVCDTRQNCANGEDEQEALCSDLPKSLPGHLIFYCKNRRLWIYADKKCNGFNDCGDCSDEIGSQANCPPCGSESWSCTMVVFHDYCTCIPRRFCRDGVQHCFDWSDEYLCTR